MATNEPTGRDQDQLNRIEEAVVLTLQKLRDITSNEELFVRSTNSGVCSTRSVGCNISGGRASQN
jgi:hypothetical protein